MLGFSLLFLPSKLPFHGILNSCLAHQCSWYARPFYSCCLKPQNPLTFWMKLCPNFLPILYSSKIKLLKNFKIIIHKLMTEFNTSYPLRHLPLLWNLHNKTVQKSHRNKLNFSFFQSSNSLKDASVEMLPNLYLRQKVPVISKEFEKLTFFHH